MKRAPERCPHWPDGVHTDMRVRIRYGFLWLRQRVVSVCPRCDGYIELDAVRESPLMTSIRHA